MSEEIFDDKIQRKQKYYTKKKKERPKYYGDFKPLKKSSGKKTKFRYDPNASSDE